MFLHRVKMNCKRYSTPVKIVLLITLIRTYLEVGLGWRPLDYRQCIKLFLITAVVTGGWALLKTLAELGRAYWNELCTFVVALRKFSREYWGKKEVRA